MALALAIVGVAPARAASDPIVLPNATSVATNVVSKDAGDTLGYGLQSPTTVEVCADCGEDVSAPVGSYSGGTELVFYLTDGGDTWPSTDPTHARVTQLLDGWLIEWDDAGGDGDYNDLVTKVTVRAAGPIGELKILVMGDSYSAGNGAGSYRYSSDLDSSDSDCWRSTNNYAHQFKRMVSGAPFFQKASVKNVACNGDTTAQFWSRKDGRSPQRNAVNQSYDLIFLTIGGNDAAFAAIVKQCLIRVTDSARDCEGRLKAAKKMLTDGTLYGKLLRVLQLIRSKADDRAKIVLLGYPYLEGDARYQLEYGPKLIDGYLEVGELVRELGDLGDKIQDEAIKKLNEDNRTKASNVFVKTKSLFAGPPSHELRAEYVNPNRWLVQPRHDGLFSDFWYHPNYTGWLKEAELLYRDYRVPKHDLNGQ